ncbi:TPA_asm: hypothetical protein [Porphyromonas phage phage016a_WW2866]|uniref:Uncharacterized protein n=1 Tax=Porphyromonas phage phage016a_WW2866 TaxID=3154106 RepID=A0AAT9JBG0_9CAUD
MITTKHDRFPSWALLPTVCVARRDTETFFRVEIALIFLRYCIHVYLSRPRA